MSDAPIRIGHPDHDYAADDTCGCCAGTALSTVVDMANRADLGAIVYRVGDHGRFKASMLARLASSEFPQLLALGTRADDDFSIALIDAWASVLDVLGFYQERLANEAYVGTAQERLSITELARLIGYKLHPGSAAETDLVLLMDDPPGADPDVADLEIPIGTRVQSQPGPDEVPQVFETLAPLEARVAWNRLRPRQSRLMLPGQGSESTWLEGLPSLQAGDAIVIVGRERGGPDADPGSEQWDFRRLSEVRPEPAINRTFVRFDLPLGSSMPPSPPAQADHRFYLLRQRAALFGYNAPHPRVLSARQRATFGYTTDPIEEFVPTAPGETAQTSPSLIVGSAGNIGDWSFILHPEGTQIALDAIYKGFVKGSWVALTLPSGPVELYRIEEGVDDAQARYAISGKSTRLTLDTNEGFSDFAAGYRRVSVYGASEEIAFAETPLVAGVSGQTVELDGSADLPEGRRLIFAGRRPQLVVQAESLVLSAVDGAMQTVQRGQRVTLLAAPVPLAFFFLRYWRLRSADEFEGAVVAPSGALAFVVADETAETVAEAATLARIEPADQTHSRLVLTEPLAHAYDRRSLAIHANVAPASHGESVSDILGGGDPSRPFQAAVLKQSPVTQLVAATENGVASTLAIRIDGVRWEEVANLYGRRAAERVFATQLTDAGDTVVRFGDGISGARPPAGRDNIEAEYRRGLGRAGNLRAGQLTLPLDRPLGLRETNNPLPATGGADPEDVGAARRGVPLYTLTLGRIVSVTDYRDFALGYPGVAKADARWVWQGESRRVVVTVAGHGGAAIPAGGPLHAALLEAYRRYGDLQVMFDLLDFQPVHFRLGLKVAVDADHRSKDVLAGVEAALRAAYDFDRRDFAQSVSLSGVAARAHRVPGVIAVDIDRLYREVAPQETATDHRLLVARTGRRGADGGLLPAEILTLSPEPLDALEVMA